MSSPASSALRIAKIVAAWAPPVQAVALALFELLDKRNDKQKLSALETALLVEQAKARARGLVRGVMRRRA